MNYKRLYNTMCIYFTLIPTKQRLLSRGQEVRANLNHYTEMHHITPVSCGGTDDPENLVEVLPEEHALLHLVRFKAYGERSDFLSVRFSLNGYDSKSHLKSRFQEENVSFCSVRALFKAMVPSFREAHGWHSEEGRKAISESRLGTYPCVDAKTGESVGSFRKDHPKVVSGDWVHHSSGKVSVTRISDGERLYTTCEDYAQGKGTIYSWNGSDNRGSANNNFKEMTPERRQRLFALIPLCTEENHVKKKTLEAMLKEEFKEFKRISTVWIDNNFGSISGLVEEYNKELDTELKYNPYFRSKSQRSKLAVAARNPRG